MIPSQHPAAEVEPLGAGADQVARRDGPDGAVDVAVLVMVVQRARVHAQVVLAQAARANRDFLVVKGRDPYTGFLPES
jgi:hypothetical protein